MGLQHLKHDHVETTSAAVLFDRLYLNPLGEFAWSCGPRHTLVVGDHGGLYFDADGLAHGRLMRPYLTWGRHGTDGLGEQQRCGHNNGGPCEPNHMDGQGFSGFQNHHSQLVMVAQDVSWQMSGRPCTRIRFYLPQYQYGWTTTAYGECGRLIHVESRWSFDDLALWFW